MNQTLAEEAQPAPAAALSARKVAHRILKASTIYGMANFGLRGLNFLLLPVYTRFLSPSEYGIVAIAETLALFMLQIVNMGFEGSIQRLYYQHVDPPEELPVYLGSVLKFALAVEATFILLSFAAGPWIERLVWPHSPVRFIYFGMAIAAGAATQFFAYRQVLFQAQQRPTAYAGLAIIAFVLTAGCTVTLVVFLHLGVWGMLGGKLLGAVVCFVLAVVLVWPVLRSRFQWHFVRETLSVGYPLVPHSLMAYGLVAADRFILVRYRDLREVGIYSVGYTIGMVMSMVTMSLNQAWAPIYYEMARKGEEGRRVLGRMCSLIPIGLSGVACFGVLLVRFVMPYFVGRSYEPAVRLVPWILGAYFMHSLFSMFSFAAMQARRTKLILVASFSALALNTLLNFALIPSLGMYGAAYATFFAYVVEAIVMYRLAQRAFKLDYDLPRIFAAVGIFGMALAVTQIPFSPVLSIVMTAVVGIACLGLLAVLGWKIARQTKKGLLQPGRL